MTLHAFHENPGHTARCYSGDHALNFIEIGLCASAEGPEIGVRFSNKRYVSRCADMLPARDTRNRLRGSRRAMMRSAKGQQIQVAGEYAGHCHRQVDRFGPGICKMHNPCFASRHGCHQFFHKMAQVLGDKTAWYNGSAPAPVPSQRRQRVDENGRPKCTHSCQ